MGAPLASGLATELRQRCPPPLPVPPPPLCMPTYRHSPFFFRKSVSSSLYCTENQQHSFHQLSTAHAAGRSRLCVRAAFPLCPSPGRQARLPSPTPLRPPLLSACLSPVVYSVAVSLRLFALCPPRTPQPVVRAAPVSARLSLSASVCGWQSFSRYIYIYIYFKVIVTHDNSGFPKRDTAYFQGWGRRTTTTELRKGVRPLVWLYTVFRANHVLTSTRTALHRKERCAEEEGWGRDFVALY